MACFQSFLHKLKIHFQKTKGRKFPLVQDEQHIIREKGSWMPSLSSIESSNPTTTQNDNDAQYWHRTVGGDLDALMQEAGYASENREKGLEFCSACVFPFLGSAIASSQVPAWRSFMTDDFSPLEYSWSWDGSPQVRFSWDPIGDFSGTKSDPFNRRRPLECSQKLRATLQGSDWTWFDTIADSFYDSRLGAPVPVKDMSCPSSIMFAAELSTKGQVGVKAYLVPVLAEQAGRTRLSVLSDTVQRLETDSLTLPAYQPLRDFIRGCESSRPFHIIGVAIDMVIPALSRLKIYLRGPQTSFSSVRSVLTLDGTNDRWTESLLKELQELWYSVFALDASFPVDSELPLAGHETAGILYNLDVQANNVTPDSKVYIPIKHYSQNDQSGLDGLVAFLERTGRSEYTPNFVRAAQRVCAHRDLSAGRGFQTYVSCAVKKGKLSLTSYFSPELFHQGRYPISAV